MFSPTPASLVFDMGEIAHDGSRLDSARPSQLIVAALGAGRPKGFIALAQVALRYWTKFESVVSFP